MPAKNGRVVKCTRCGASLYRTPSVMPDPVNGRFFCSHQCRIVPMPPDGAKRKLWARRRTHKSIQTGVLIKPPSCSKCGTAGPVDAHHRDYSKPLEVEWLCRACHDVESRQARLIAVERQRKHFAPCACGRKAVCRGMCHRCQEYWRTHQPHPKCLVPDCMNSSFGRGLCLGHLRTRDIREKYALPPAKKGPHPPSA